MSLVFERELFGQEPVGGRRVEEMGDRADVLLQRLQGTMVPLLERTSRMMRRSLDRLRHS